MIEVSVCLITYNQENYIEQALLSILSQECDFPYEVIISNDCSTDNTHHVITKVLANNAHKKTVKYYNQNKNLGMMPNLLFTIGKAKGKYIAFLEGDDYWIDVHKIKKQANILQYRHGISLVCTGNTVLLPDSTTVEKLLTNVLGSEIVFDINTFQTVIVTHFQTLMIRKNEDVLLQLQTISKAKDFTIFFLSLKYGKGIYINELTSVYRMHPDGVWSPKSNIENLRWEFEESKQLFRIKENRKFIRHRHFFNALNYAKVANFSKVVVLQLLISISWLVRTKSEAKQLIHSIYSILRK